MGEMNEKDALQVIEKMIASARQEAKDNGFHFMLWGWLVLIAALSDYVMLVFMEKEYHSWVWAILMPLGGITSAVANWMEKKQDKRVKTYVDDIMQYMVKAFAISLFIVCFIMPFTGQSWRVFYPVLMTLYAIFLFVSGGALKFKPLIIGGFINWLMATIAFFVTYDWQLLALSAAVLGGYIIPGHMLKARFKTNV